MTHLLHSSLFHLSHFRPTEYELSLLVQTNWQTIRRALLLLCISRVYESLPGIYFEFCARYLNRSMYSNYMLTSLSYSATFEKQKFCLKEKNKAYKSVEILEYHVFVFQFNRHICCGSMINISNDSISLFFLIIIQFTFNVFQKYSIDSYYISHLVLDSFILFYSSSYAFI